MTNKLLILLFVSMTAYGANAQNYRVKRINNSHGYIMTLNYTDTLLTSYAETGENNETFQLQYDKNKIIITSNRSKKKEEIKFNKQGQVEKVRNIDLKYNKEGYLNWYKEKDLHGQWSDEGKLLYDENNRLKTIFGSNQKLGDAVLLFYNENDKCVRALKGSYIKKIMAVPYDYVEDQTAVWDGDKIKSIESRSGLEDIVSSRIEFEYNTNGLVTKERLFKLNKSTKELELEIETTIEYEEGKGNENLTFLSYRNMPINIPFGINTFTFYKYIYM